MPDFWHEKVAGSISVKGRMAVVQTRLPITFRAGMTALLREPGITGIYRMWSADTQASLLHPEC